MNTIRGLETGKEYFLMLLASMGLFYFVGIIYKEYQTHVASDIANALGYSNTRKSVSDHCKGVTKRYPSIHKSI